MLDCPGGGLRIDTIHAFSQWLLAAFPEEAGLIPGTKPMEDRDREVLAMRVLADLLVDWEERGETKLLDGLEMLSVRMGPDGARKWLMRCAEARDAWLGPGAWQEPLGDRVRGLIGLPLDAGPESLAGLCGDDVFDCAALKRCLEINAAWGTPTAQKCIDAVEEWLAGHPAARAEGCDALFRALFTNDGKVRSLASLQKLDANYEGMAERVRECLDAVREQAALLALADLLVPALTVGRRFALAWDEAKTREGLIDFDDQIRQAAALLSRSDVSDWIRYKLDRQFDHILIDEAQDTNEAQWSIIRALTEEFFAGAGQRDNKLRTVFVVGDYKQAIFRFQGTSPENFEIARRHFAQAMADAAANNLDVRELRNLGSAGRTARPSRCSSSSTRRSRRSATKRSVSKGHRSRTSATSGPASSACGIRSAARATKRPRSRNRPTAGCPGRNARWPTTSPRRSRPGSTRASRWSRARSAMPVPAISWCSFASAASWPD